MLLLVVSRVGGGELFAPTAEKGLYDNHGKLEAANLNMDSSSPYNWAGWDIQKVKRVDNKTLEITLKNKSEQAIDGSLEFRFYPVVDGKMALSDTLVIVKSSTDFSYKNLCTDVSGGSMTDKIQPGQTVTCKLFDVGYKVSLDTIKEIKPDAFGLSVDKSGLTGYVGSDTDNGVFPDKSFKIED
ncbi:hypothetical protein [Bifidobacterium moraviense]|uniref:hypothetical protein n=1 Tax=Bifidobacterium moraviense TaxID=2675323 RepID=UPI00145CCC5D|nr:hypothetical protein [Bifidobacterium sp. DSM 109958]